MVAEINIFSFLSNISFDIFNFSFKTRPRKKLIRSSFWNFLLCVLFNKCYFYPDFPWTKQNILLQKKSVISVALSAAVAKDCGLVSQYGCRRAVCAQPCETIAQGLLLVFESESFPMQPRWAIMWEQGQFSCKTLRGLTGLMVPGSSWSIHSLYTVGLCQAPFAGMVHFQRLFV